MYSSSAASFEFCAFCVFGSHTAFVTKAARRRILSRHCSPNHASFQCSVGEFTAYREFGSHKAFSYGENLTKVKQSTLSDWGSLNYLARLRRTAYSLGTRLTLASQAVFARHETGLIPSVVVCKSARTIDRDFRPVVSFSWQSTWHKCRRAYSVSQIIQHMAVCVTLYECPWHPYIESLPTLWLCQEGWGCKPNQHFALFKFYLFLLLKSLIDTPSAQSGRFKSARC